MTKPTSLEEAQHLDLNDPFAPFRASFAIAPGLIYLDGNSLGPLQHGVRERLAETVSEQWGVGLIRSWNTYDWIDLSTSVAARIAPLIGAPQGTVAVADSTSVNLFKLLAAALRLRPERKVILSEKGNFPTDLYVATKLAEFLGQGHELRTVEASGIADAIDADTAVVLLTEVNYRTGSRLDMAQISAIARKAGALTLWDLAHSAGAFPVDVEAAGVDFAVGCGYKYLNGGPGAPSFAYVAAQHLAGLFQPIGGWQSHVAPFSFSEDYEPAPSIEVLRTGTPPVLSLAGLDAALAIFEGIDMAALRRKADQLFDIFVGNVEAGCPQLELLTPRDPGKRGTQASFAFDNAYAAVQAMIARGVIGDFRSPDIMRFGLTPLYLSHQDVWQAARILCEVMSSRAWDNPAYMTKAKVV